MLKRSLSITLVLAILTVGSFVVAAADQTVTFWTNDNEAERIAVYEEVAEEFMEKNPEIKVEIVPIDETDLPQKIASSRAANNLPDLLRGGIERVIEFSSEELLNQEMASDVIDNIGEGKFSSGTLNKVFDESKDNYAAIPYEGWIQGIFYREDIFEKHNLSSPGSWSDLNAAVDKLPGTEDVKYALTLGTDPGRPSTQQWFEMFAISNEAWPFDEEGNVTMDTPEMVEALEFYTNLQRGAVPGPQYWRRARGTYQTGQTAMIIYSTYILGDLLDEDAVSVKDLHGKTNVATEIVGPEGEVATYGRLNNLLIFKNAAPATAKVAEYFLQEGYTDILSTNVFGKVPVLKEVSDEWKSLSPKLEQYPDQMIDEMLNGYENMQQWIYRSDYGPIELEVIGEMHGRRLVPEVISNIAIEGSMTPKEGAEWLQDRVEEMVEERK